ncbi:MAG: SGNH/GDSL hydrolase family protein [Planctomycetota bacterium]
MNKTFATLALSALSAALPLMSARPQETLVMGVGDSIGEAVQSADASSQTQPYSYLNMLAYQLGVAFPLPLIDTTPFAWVGNTVLRSRIAPDTLGANLAVSGADVHSLLYEQANAASEAEIDSETDLVLFPRLGSQVEIVEEVRPLVTFCWIGNNDVLSSVLSFDQLDGSQLTPVAEFEADFHAITQRLGAASTVVVFANIPDVTSIAFLADREDLLRFLGSDYGLPAGDYTSIVAVFLVKLGLANGTIFQDPDYVLDSSEVALIQQRIADFNRIIEEAAAIIGMPVVDINALYDAIKAHPPTPYGVPLTTRFLGGLFSLDGVHPSDIGQALVAIAFISKINAYFGVRVPSISSQNLTQIFLNDPFVDKDADGRVAGRSDAGLLETLAPLLGVSGDTDDHLPNPPAARGDGATFLARYLQVTGQHAAPWTQERMNAAFKEIFGLDGLIRKQLP